MKKNQILILAAVILLILIAGIAYTKSDIFKGQTHNAPQGDESQAPMENPQDVPGEAPAETGTDEMPAAEPPPESPAQ